MKINEEEFFHQATLKICSELDVEKSLKNTLDYLRNYIPADDIFFAIYNPESGTGKTIADAHYDNNKRKHIAKDFTIPKKFKAEANDRWLNFKGVEIENYDNCDPMGEWFNSYFWNTPVSRITMSLDLTGERLGIIGVNKVEFIYTDVHANLFKLLHEPFAIALSNALRYREVLELKDILSDDSKFFQTQLRDFSGTDIIGANFGLKPVLDLMRQVAPLNSPVLLLGESGVGKEVIANGIHSFSERKNAPFIKVNCGAIPENLIDSELFGHEKGAFTGAFAQKRGRFERAQNGTIFLDEIGELSPAAQVKLLRVIQNKEIERVGGARSIPIDVRIIAATNRDLHKMMEDGSFREDLWFRINVFPILVPPLRSRTEDIPALVQHFIAKKSKEFKIHPFPKVASQVYDLMMEYSWPGNVRELENAVERAIIRGKTGVLREEHFYLPTQFDKKMDIKKSKDQAKIVKLDDLIEKHIKQVLVKTKGKIHGKGGAAQFLGINPNTLRSKMRKLNIPFN